MVRPAVYVLDHVLTPGAERMLDGSNAPVSTVRISSNSELTNSVSSCRHSGEFALRDALVRLMPSAHSTFKRQAARPCRVDAADTPLIATSADTFRTSHCLR
jgi:hypothetical protein